MIHPTEEAIDRPETIKPNVAKDLFKIPPNFSTQFPGVRYQVHESGKYLTFKHSELPFL
jgi:hypothetical protein